MDPAALLKMLEPAVRPVPTQQAGTAQLPIEQRSFESLLIEAQQETDPTMQTPQAGDAAEASTKVEPLRPLQHFGAIENASLRGIVGRQ